MNRKLFIPANELPHNAPEDKISEFLASDQGVQNFIKYCNPYVGVPSTLELTRVSGINHGWMLEAGVYVQVSDG